MSMEAVLAFWKRVESNTELQQRVQPGKGEVPKLHAGVSAAELEGLAKIARQAGFDCTAEELRAAESVAGFWERVSSDEALQKSLLPAEGLPRAEAVSLVLGVANKSGFRFDLAQLDAVSKAKLRVKPKTKGELSDDQVEAVAGGTITDSTSSFSLNFTAPITLTKVVAYYQA
jgi:hypothetical protein